MKKLMVIFLFFTIGCEHHEEKPPEPVDPVKQMGDAVQSSPTFENYINYGLALSGAGRSADALAAYDKASGLNPKSPLSWNNICAEDNKIGDYIGAVENCEKALAADDKFELAKTNLQSAKDKLDQSKKTAQEKKAQISKGSATPADIVDAGLAFYGLRDYMTAIEIWKKVKSKDGMYARAQTDIGSAYIKMRKFDLAEGPIDTAIKLEPTNPLYVNNKKWLEDERKKKE